MLENFLIKYKDNSKVYLELLELSQKAYKMGFTFEQNLNNYLLPILNLNNTKLIEIFLKAFNIIQIKTPYGFKAFFDPLILILSSLKSLDSSIEQNTQNTQDIEPIQLAILYLELLTDCLNYDLSYNQVLYLSQTLPKAIFKLDKLQRCFQVKQMQKIVKQDFYLLDYFLDGLDKKLKHLKNCDLEAFLNNLNNLEPNKRKSFLSLSSKLALDIFQETQTTANLSFVQNFLNNYLKARLNSQIYNISIRPVSSISSIDENNNFKNNNLVATDGKFIYLTDQIDRFDNKLDNINLYKCLTKLECCYYEFGTFFCDLEKLRQNLILKDLFLIFEHGRIRKILIDLYHGMFKTCFTVLEKEAFNILNSNQISNNELFLLYMLISLGITNIKNNNFNFSSLFFNLFDLFEKNINKNSSSQDCLDLACKIFQDNQYFQDLQIKQDYKALITPFGWNLSYELILNSSFYSDIKLNKLYYHGFEPKENQELSNQKDNLKNQNISQIEQNKQEQIINYQDFTAQEQVFWYKEWDCSLNDYLENHARLMEKTVSNQNNLNKNLNFYEETLKKHGWLVKKIKNSFEALKPEGLEILRKWTEGEELDYSSLLDFYVDKKANIMPSDKIYIKKVKKNRDVAVLVLIDISKSTSNQVSQASQASQNQENFENNFSILDIEKEALVLFSEALEAIGDSFAIAAFSGVGRLRVDYFKIKDFDEQLSSQVKSRFEYISPQRNTRMGAAIRHAVKKLEETPQKTKILIILSDGFPNDNDYKKDYAIEDTRKAILEASSKNIYTRAITVNMSLDSRLSELYGNLSHNLISNICELPDKLLRIYKNLTKNY